MPRNGSGVFSVINPILIGRLRSSSAVNANFTDMGKQITNSLPLDGTAAMTGQIKAANGSTASPALGFADDPNTGFRRRAADSMAWVAGAVDRFYIDANGKAWHAGDMDVAGDFSASGTLSGESNVGQIITGDALGILLRDADDGLTYQDGLIEPIQFFRNNLTAATILGDVRIPFSGTLVAYSITADQTGSASVEIWKDTFANYPPTSADKITGSAPIALVTQQANAVNPIADWTSVTVTAGDVLRFYLATVSGGIDWVAITLAIKRGLTT